jgi:hypothetical protein
LRRTPTAVMVAAFAICTESSATSPSARTVHSGPICGNLMFPCRVRTTAKTPSAPARASTATTMTGFLRTHTLLPPPTA